ncbi:hypothetical protein MLD38_019105 [Melastoma candidum]|uniref:Uncharacterized protein n=1 Tax=Melastoma candidum TaxID=119954 RepID=A0ACB9QW09_9MYRT|nr:hypothetical protein MLD38_019105 [Melastoma candidum]
MLTMRRRLACCIRDRVLSIDYDDPEGMVTYNGLDVCIINNESYENESRSTSREEGCPTDSFDDGDSSCSSSKDLLGSTSSKWVPTTQDEDRDYSGEWDPTGSSRFSFSKERPSCVASDIVMIKEKFAKLLLGDDVTGGSNGHSTALALSNAITNLAATIFGELWKLEPLSEEKKERWKREMNWLVSPTKYMIELVPTKRSGKNGSTLEIMTPRARADILVNLPALQKLDSLLIETLDSMAGNEFWYADGCSQMEGWSKTKKKSKKWWLPSPQVPRNGLSDTGRKKLISRVRIVYQVLKAAKSINESILAEMPMPTIIKDALPKSGKASLGEDLYSVLNSEPSSVDHMFRLLNLQTDHSILDCINKLELAMFAWKERIHEQEDGKSPSRTSWSFIKDPIHELEKTEALLDRAESLMRFLKANYPNLPHTFLNASKVQYGKDVGHAILEAYSRVLVNLAFNILTRIQDVLQKDAAINNTYSSASTPASIPGGTFSDILGSPAVINPRIKHSLFPERNGANERDCLSASTASTSEGKTPSVTATPSRSRARCVRQEPFTP